MRKLPKACVCIMLYNHEPWVRETIQSAFDQDYPNLTIVISDDASTDNTASIVENMVNGYDGIHEVIFNKTSKNLGRIEHFKLLHDSPRICEAEYHFHSDGDDIMMTNRVSKSMEVFIKQGVSFLSCNAQIIDTHGKTKRIFRNPNRIHDLSIETFIKVGWNPVCFGAGMAWRKDVLDQFGGTPSGTRNGDQIIPFRGLLLGDVAYISNPLVKWRHHENNTSLGLQLENTTDEKAQTIIQERMQCNQVANYIVMYNELVTFIEKTPQYPKKNLIRLLEKRILKETYHWISFRYSMAQLGIGLE